MGEGWGVTAVTPPSVPPSQAGLQTLQALGPEMRRALSCDLEGEEGPNAPREEEQQLTYAVSTAGHAPPATPCREGHTHPDTPCREGHAHPATPFCSQAPETLYSSAPSPPPAPSPVPTEGEDPAPLPHIGTHRLGSR